jgi:hypothetical protein
MAMSTVTFRHIVGRMSMLSITASVTRFMKDAVSNEGRLTKGTLQSESLEELLRRGPIVPAAGVDIPINRKNSKQNNYNGTYMHGQNYASKRSMKREKVRRIRAQKWGILRIFFFSEIIIFPSFPRA